VFLRVLLSFLNHYPRRRLVYVPVENYFLSVFVVPFFLPPHPPLGFLREIHHILEVPAVELSKVVTITGKKGQCKV
jgi:hypothetical protein